MRVTFKTPLPFIMKPGILVADIEPLGGGSYKFYTPDNFKQILKQSEYDAVCLAAGVGIKEPETVEPEKSNATSDELKLVARKRELDDMSKQELLDLARESYDSVNKNTKMDALIELILDAEADED